jgi:hypothetical protein
MVWASVWDSPVEAGEFYHIAGQAIEKRFSTKAAAGSTELVKKYAGAGRSIQLSTAEVAGRPVVIYVDVPAGASTSIVQPSQVTLTQ